MESFSAKKMIFPNISKNLETIRNMIIFCSDKKQLTCYMITAIEVTMKSTITSLTGSSMVPIYTQHVSSKIHELNIHAVTHVSFSCNSTLLSK